FVLAADPSGELVGAEEAQKRAKFHEMRQQRLEKMLLDNSCDAECRGAAAEILLNGLPEFGGAYARVPRAPRAQRGAGSGAVHARLHRRLLLCQLDAPAGEKLLTDVLLPSYADLAAPTNGKANGKKGERDRDRPAEELVDLVSLLDVPAGVKLPDTLARSV